LSGTGFGARQLRLQINLANRFAKTVIGPSQAVASAFIAEGGNPELPLVVPNGFEIPEKAAPKAELRQTYGLPSSPVIGVFSRLAPLKGQHIVLRALKALPSVQCLFAGDALFGEDAYAESLNALVAELGLSGRVSFLGRRNDVPRLMRAVDIVVHPSVQPESFATTLLEAMAAGTPIVATDTGGSSEALAGGDAGALVPAGDANALALAIRTILAKPPGLHSMIERAQRRVRLEYSVERMRQSIVKAVDKAAAGEHP
jgi:glycosyltransferase involved in cell wall biosynthesis